VGKSWFLESIAADGSPMTQPIFRLPFRVGRDPANDLAVPPTTPPVACA
jgi:hypothetical protein